jgi:hypothetical protein
MSGAPCHRDLDYYVHRCPEFDAQPPGVHALVIGTSSYPRVKRLGMRPFRDLPGAAVGAARFARWLATEYQHPQRLPLLTVRVLLTPTRGEEQNQIAALQLTSQAATRTRVKNALENWWRDCDGHAENLSILYLAGHGIVNVSDSPTVFLSTANNFDPYEESISVSRIRAAMLRTKAHDNILALDCCQDRQYAFEDVPGAGVGLPIHLDRDELRETELVINASRIGRATYALDAKRGTLMSSALSSVLRGAGRVRATQFVISDPPLERALKEEMQRILRDMGSLAASDYEPRVRGKHAECGVHEPAEYPTVAVQVVCPSTLEASVANYRFSRRLPSPIMCEGSVGPGQTASEELPTGAYVLDVEDEVGQKLAPSVPVALSRPCRITLTAPDPTENLP